MNNTKNKNSGGAKNSGGVKNSGGPNMSDQKALLSTLYSKF